MLISEALKEGRHRLQAAGIAEALTECEHMLMKLLNATRSEVLIRMNAGLCPTAQALFASEPSAQPVKANRELSIEQEKQFFAWIIGREKRIPLAYLLGDVFFHSLKLRVGTGCLIPRPETERLVEEITTVFRERINDKLTFADIGCGSGAIGLALLSVFPQSAVVFMDRSPEAIKFSETNARSLGFEKRSRFILSDIFSGLEGLPGSRKEETFDAIISNPPYLTRADMRTLQPEVAYEPGAALDGGEDGLDFYRKIVPAAREFLKPGGVIALEFGFSQAAAVKEELKIAGYENIQIFKDHQGIERVSLANVG